MRRSLALIVLASLASLAACSSAMRQATSPASRDGYLASADGTRLYFRVQGSAPDTVIAVHGGPGVDLESIVADFAPLAERHTVIFYDQRGAGRSELPSDTTRLGARQQVEDLDAVRRHFGLSRVALLAHSYGPLLAADYAIAHPDRVRRMVFFGPVPPRRGDFFTRFGAAMAARLDSAAVAGLGSASRALASSGADTAGARRACRAYWAIATRPRVADPSRMAQTIRSDLCASDPAGIRYGLGTTNRIVFRSYGDWDLRPALHGLQVPTLVVYGDAEAIPLDLVEEWISAMPHARLLHVPGAAHFTYAEQPGLVWPEVERFLAER